MTTVMVSGCFDIIHGGHVQFLREAAALGGKLLVCVAGDDVIIQHKGRPPAMSEEHREWVIRNLSMVTDTYITSPGDIGLDFVPFFRLMRPDILAVTQDDAYTDAKRELCQEVGARYVMLEQTPPNGWIDKISATSIRTKIAGTDRVPLRVDFGGGWLDVPKHAQPGAYIVNCAIQPRVTLTDLLHDGVYHRRSGLGGSAAWAMVTGRDPFAAEAEMGVGWQDPAVITETGLCTWASGPKPRLLQRTSGAILRGKMALWWTGHGHDIKEIADRPRDYDLIQRAGDRASLHNVHQDEDRCVSELMSAMHLSLEAQIAEGMLRLPHAGGTSARKYLGAGWGGYALYLFETQAERDKFVEIGDEDARAIEPYCKWSDA